MQLEIALVAINKTIDADGTKVQVSKCPNDHGKIKSPSCCGQEMICEA